MPQVTVIPGQRYRLLFEIDGKSMVGPEFIGESGINTMDVQLDSLKRIAVKGAVKGLTRKETATEGFTFVNASAIWRPLENDPTLAVILKAENIFDETGRRHSSFTKEFVPLPGRNFSVAVRMSM